MADPKEMERILHERESSFRRANELKRGELEAMLLVCAERSLVVRKQVALAPARVQASHDLARHRESVLPCCWPCAALAYEMEYRPNSAPFWGHCLLSLRLQLFWVSMHQQRHSTSRLFA